MVGHQQAHPTLIEPVAHGIEQTGLAPKFNAASARENHAQYPVVRADDKRCRPDRRGSPQNGRLVVSKQGSQAMHPCLKIG